MTRLLHTVLDTTDLPRAVDFYRGWLGWELRERLTPDADWAVLTGPDGGRLAFQLVDALAESTWPDPAVPQQLHLDFLAPDRQALEADHATLTGLGARVLLERLDDPQEPLRVYADPDGHPFCVFTWVEA